MAEAGWYPDPGGQDGLRWFDGSAWSHEVMASPTITSPVAPPGPAVAPVAELGSGVPGPRYPSLPAAGWHLLIAFGVLLAGAVLLPFASAGGDATAIISDPEAAVPILALIAAAIVAGLVGRAGYDVGAALGAGVVLVFSVVMALIAPIVKVLFDLSNAFGGSIEPNIGIVCLGGATVVGLIVTVPVIASIAKTQGKTQFPPVLGWAAAGGAALYLWGVTRPAYPGAPILTGDWYFDSVLFVLFAAIAIPALLTLATRTAPAAALLGGVLVFPAASWFASAVGSSETFGVQQSAGYEEMGIGLIVALVAVAVGVFSGAQRGEFAPEGVRYVPARSNGALVVTIGLVLVLGLVALSESNNTTTSTGYDPTAPTDIGGDCFNHRVLARGAAAPIGC